MYSLFGSPQITKTDFLKMRADDNAHRICFQTTHRNALKPYKNKFKHRFEVPFFQSVGPLFQNQTEIELYRSNFGGGFWTGLETDGDAEAVKQWMESKGSTVFLRDKLSASFAMSMHMTSDNSARSAIGELEFQAKANHSLNAIEKIVNELVPLVSDLRQASKIDCITVPPPRPNKDFDLPTQIAGALSKELNVPFLEMGSWAGDKGQLKELSMADKWDKLEAAHLVLKDSFKDKSIWIIDDLYQSGTTLNFLGGKLFEAGAREVNGLCVVKAAKDTDNI
jgi:predicted amidophosphoribosyltransferase